MIYGLLPGITSLVGFKGAIGWASGGFYACYDLGVGWEKEGPEYALMTAFGGIVAGALYCGVYNWQGASEDLASALETANHYEMDYEDVLRIWVKTHDEFEKHQDVLEQSADKLYRDRVLDDRYWEEVLLST